MGIYSFNGNKIITTSGGGMLISEDEALISRARYLATQAREPAAHYEHVAIGYNYRMSNILAGVGRGQLRVLPDRVAARRSVFERYASGLKGHPEIQWMPEPEWSFSNRWLTACVLDAARSRLNSQSLMQKLAAERIEARPVWKPMQLQPVFRGTRYFPHSDSNSVSEALFRDGLCLPSGSNLTAAQQDRVIDTIQRMLS
jgi:dTDP-4-amino-4,6-dideoxygalactose transaminase